MTYLEPDNVPEALSAWSLQSNWKDRRYANEYPNTQFELWQKLWRKKTQSTLRQNDRGLNLDGMVRKDVLGGDILSWDFRNEWAFTGQKLEEQKGEKASKKVTAWARVTEQDPLAHWKN